MSDDVVDAWIEWWNWCERAGETTQFPYYDEAGNERWRHVPTPAARAAWKNDQPAVRCERACTEYAKGLGMSGTEFRVAVTKRLVDGMSVEDAVADLGEPRVE